MFSSPSSFCSWLSMLPVGSAMADRAVPWRNLSGLRAKTGPPTSSAKTRIGRRLPTLCATPMATGSAGKLKFHRFRPRAREHGTLAQRNVRGFAQVLGPGPASHSAGSRCAGWRRIGRAASPETEIEEEESMTDRLCVLARKIGGGPGNWVRGRAE